MKVTLNMCLNYSKLQLLQTYKSLQEKVQVGLVIDHTISISKYNLFAGSIYIRLPKALDHPRKRLINIQNIDNNESFKWCLLRCLYPVNHNPTRIRKADKEFAKKLYFKNIKFPVKVRNIHKIQKKLHRHQRFWLRV